MFLEIQNFFMIKFITMQNISLSFWISIACWRNMFLVNIKSLKHLLDKKYYFKSFYLHYFTKLGFTFHALVVWKFFIGLFFLSQGNMLSLPVTYLSSRTCVLDLHNFLQQIHCLCFHTTREHCWIIKIWLFFILDASLSNEN